MLTLLVRVRYLLKKYFVGDEEDRKMALLCMGYLTFDCFDADLSDDDIRQNITAAKYAFQDYAVAHWIDLLKASLQNADAPCSDHELVDLANDFIPRHWNDAFKPNARLPKQVKAAFRALEGHDVRDQLLQVYHFRNADAPSTEATVEPLELHRIVQRIRQVFEGLVSSLPAHHGDQGLLLRKYYGASWFKCPRLTCCRFYDGFASARKRDAHYQRHSRPFRCDVAGCFAAALGCASAQSLKKHKAEYHSSGGFLFPSYGPKAVAAGKAVGKDKIALLFDLARKGDIRTLEQHLDPTCISVTDAKRDTLMHVAARLGNVDLAQTLISCAASGPQPGTCVAAGVAALVNARNKNRATPLDVCLCKKANEPMAKLLVKNGATTIGRNLPRLINLAARIRDAEFSQCLSRNVTKFPPLFPIEDEDVMRAMQRMAQFIGSGYPVNVTRLLYCAASNGDKKVARICLDHGADIAGLYNEVPLVTAASHGHDGMVRLLLEAGANPNSSDLNESALTTAALHGRTSVLQVLLECGDIDVNLAPSTNRPARTSSGKTALMLAAEKGHLEVVRALLQRQDIDIAAVDNDGLDAFGWARKGSNDDVVAEIGAFRRRNNKE